MPRIGRGPRGDTATDGLPASIVPGTKLASPRKPATQRSLGVAYTSSGVPTWAILPSLTIATRSPKVKASSRSWVTKIAVTPIERNVRRTSLRTSVRSPASRLENGSSSKSTRGLGAIARARATRCC